MVLDGISLTGTNDRMVQSSEQHRIAQMRMLILLYILREPSEWSQNDRILGYLLLALEGQK